MQIDEVKFCKIELSFIVQEYLKMYLTFFRSKYLKINKSANSFHMIMIFKYMKVSKCKVPIFIFDGNIICFFKPKNNDLIPIIWCKNVKLCKFQVICIEKPFIMSFEK